MEEYGPRFLPDRCESFQSFRKEKIKFFGRSSGEERMSMQYSGLMNEPERRVIRQLARIHGVRRKERQKIIFL